ncbi:protein of unknown function (DUF4102) [Photorhabdus temperata subsp. temperata Meg1]|uniref:Phage integrase central domain-containing protein n=1 Tax=Photorhabdus temperata subsp. temperata Meg1 TaxID=1393735 RepID=A0A081RR35_PHOTE|nr:protein of unknown function (DUF4102) [Photorhabdus temperata subsp. temperata Meg1]
MTSGSFYWRMKYRYAGKEKCLAFGAYPEISLAEARDKREAIVREWHQQKAERWSPCYRDEIIDTFEKDIFPYIGKRPIAEIKPMELLEALRKMEKRGALEKMRKVRQRCGEGVPLCDCHRQS